MLTTAQALDFPLSTKVFEHPADEIDANSGARLLNIRDPKRILSPLDGRQGEFRFGASGRGGLPYSPLEFLISIEQGVEDEIDIRPRVVFALVPAQRALVKCFVIAILVLFDQPFKADVAADLITQMAGLPRSG